MPSNLHYEPSAGRPCALTLGTRPRCTIGRNADCDLVIQDRSVSRAHAAISAVEDLHVLQDLGSSNGTFLNGLRLVSAHTFALRSGDVIEIGATRLTYGTGPSTPSAAREAVDVDAPLLRSYPVADLLRDGARAHGPAVAAADEKLLIALRAAARRKGVERCLELVARELGCDSAAIYEGEPGQGSPLEPVATFPSKEPPSFRPLVFAAWTERAARHEERSLFSRVCAGRSETLDMPRASVLAVPFFRRKRGCIVAVGRASGERFDRALLSHGALFAERLACAISLGRPDVDETSFGSDDGL